MARTTWTAVICGWLCAGPLIAQEPGPVVASMTDDGPAASFVDLDRIVEALDGGAPLDGNAVQLDGGAAPLNGSAASLPQADPAPGFRGGRSGASVSSAAWFGKLMSDGLASLPHATIDRLLIDSEPLQPGIWPAPEYEDCHLVEGGGGFLGLRGAVEVARYGTMEVLPTGIIYRPYLAGQKESRLSSKVLYERDDGWLFDNTLGGQVGLVRWGTTDAVFPQGVQIDVEASAQLRVDIPEDLDFRGADFRAGLPVTFGYGRHRTKLGYYHLSSHLGDEFLLDNPDFDRLNFARDVLLFAHAVYLTPSIRVYGEAGWAFDSDVSERWEFQTGLDYAPARGTGPRGAPFLAINGHFRQELNYSGSLALQAGWSWRSNNNGRLLRIGGHYFNGPSTQLSFFDQHEQLAGFGVWIDN